MAQFLGRAPSVKAILAKIDFLCGLVSTFDLMMHGFYKES